jgi:homoserine kinase
MKRILIKSPATSGNVGPGYDIFALALSHPHDEVEIVLDDSELVKIEILNDSQNIPTALNDNTAGLAILELLKRNQLTQGMTVRIIKKMKSGGGMGTTGASAAAAVYGVNELLKLNLSMNEMIDIARMGEVASGGSPHADNVAASLLGGFILVKSYNPIDVLKIEMPEFPVVFAAIKKSQRTTRGFITYEIGQEKLKDQMARCSRIIHAIHTKDIQEFGSAFSTDHIAEPVRGASIPEYHTVKKQVLDAGAFGFQISGGGSSVISICSKEKMDEVVEIMEKGFENNPYFVQVYKTSTSNQGVEIIS